MSFKLKNGQGIQALDPNEIIEVFRDGCVVDGAEVTAGSSGLELDVASGTVKVEGTEHSISSETITLDSADTDPRKDVVYVDDTGSVEVVKGEAEPADPSSDTRFDTAKPVPASLYSVTGTVLAEVWVDANASSLTSDDIRDRRLFLEIETGDTENLTDTESIDAPITNDTELTDFEGANLSINENGELEADADGASSDAIATEAEFVVFKDGTEYKVMDRNGNVDDTTTSESNAEDAIQYAYDNLPTEGGTILLADGEYQVSGQVDAVANSTIKGGRSAVLTLQNSSTNTVFYTDRDNVRFEGFKIEGDGNVSTDPPNSAIRAENCSDVEVVDMELVNGWRLVIHFNGVTRGKVKDCYIEGAGTSSDSWYGFNTWISNHTETLEDSFDLHIENCTVREFNANGIGLYGAERFSVKGCTVFNVKQGISCSPSRHGVVSENLVRDTNVDGQNDEGGIEVESSSTHTDGNMSSMESHDVTVVDNVIQNAEYGVYSRVRDDGDSEPYSIMYKGNSIENCDKGVYLDECDTVGVVANNIRNCAENIDQTSNASNTTVSNNITR